MSKVDDNEGRTIICRRAAVAVPQDGNDQPPVDTHADSQRDAAAEESLPLSDLSRTPTPSSAKGKAKGKGPSPARSPATLKNKGKGKEPPTEALAAADEMTTGKVPPTEAPPTTKDKGKGKAKEKQPNAPTKPLHIQARLAKIKAELTRIYETKEKKAPVEPSLAVGPFVRYMARVYTEEIQDVRIQRHLRENVMTAAHFKELMIWHGRAVVERQMKADGEAVQGL